MFSIVELKFNDAEHNFLWGSQTLTSTFANIFLCLYKHFFLYFCIVSVQTFAQKYGEKCNTFFGGG